MHIQEVVIDGFKSYSQRTVIQGWDSQFNAITGLNGSGKSNILDAICFVLGISNLSQVRAGGLQDLVYKQGQGNVTKATVTIVFNNSDPATSPIGYEHHETISVCRQIVLGGRNKYLINGHTVQASAVQNFFHSVQLNVNNPHFLIMQGRITKVLNMKPPEILGLIEEAAGTKMYENKKIQTQKVIEKKADKVNEITKVLKEDIQPTLLKLEGDRMEYLKWASNNTTCEQLSRLCVAYEFSVQEELRANGATKIATMDNDLKTAIAHIAELRSAVDTMNHDIDVQATKVAASRGPEFAKFVDAEAGANTELVKATSILQAKNATVTDAEKTRAGLAKQERDLETSATNLAATSAKQRQDSTTASDLATKLSSEVSNLQSHLMKVAAGMVSAAGDDGKSGSGAGGGGGAGTLADALMGAKKRVTSLEADISQSTMKVKHLTNKSKEMEKTVKDAEKDAKTLQASMEKTTAVLATKRQALASLGFDAKVEEAARASRESSTAAVSSLTEAYDADYAPLSALMDFSYDRAGLGGASWDNSRVHGTVASLMRIKRPDAATAIEVTAGGALYQIIVKDDETGKALLTKGNLKKRVTIIPLNRVSVKGFTKEQLEAAHAISKGAAVPALSLVSYSDTVSRAMEHIFGNTFICENATVAKAVCYDPKVRARCVTLSGDVFDPSGTLEGGAAPSAAGEPLLLRVSRLLETGEKLAAAKAEKTKAEATLAAMAKASKEYAKVSGEVDLAAHDVELMTQRLAASSLGQAQARLAEATKELAEEEACIITSKAGIKDAQAKIKELENEIKNAAAAREARVAAVEADLAKTKKAASDADAKAKKLAQAADVTSCELEQVNKERAALAATVAAAEAAVVAAKADTSAAQLVVAAAEAKYAEAKQKLDAAKSAVAAADSAHRTLVKQRSAAVDAAEKSEAARRNLEKELQATREGVGSAAKQVTDLLSKHPWIQTERQFFGQSHTDYDFKRQDPKKALANLRELEKKQHELERRINKKVLGMYETALRESNDLVSKKKIIEADKIKIESVIKELDEKKNEALKTTWGKVNKDFGSIFGTLLPGVTAKLQPPAGGTVLEGLEVKVAFNGVWKESLTELSGGQRSLLALSLILALLLFKPAPMYILDEVDAALDLSHTQNIGHMIRTHFGKSQFIVVSLKQGMFSNANVIFRTKFVDGTSTVTRTVPGSSALVLAHGGGAATKAITDGEEEENGTGKGASGKAAVTIGGGKKKATAAVGLGGK